MLSADLLGFHTYDYARHFLSSCKRILDLDVHSLPSDGTLAIHISGRDVSLRIGHVSVRSNEIRILGASDKIRDIANNWIKDFGLNKKIILSMGELDIVRGTLLTLQAFHQFLTENPLWKSEVIFVMVLNKSSSDKNVTESVRKTLFDEINQIKQQFGENVLRIVEKTLSLEELVALYTIAQVALWNSFWDGFNTVPYEFTAAQGNVFVFFFFFF